MNSGLHSGERQVAPVVSGIRRDHVARYEFAVDRLRQLEIVGIPHSNVIDMGCGIGYGSHLLALSGIGCVAVDHDQESIDYGNEHYAHHRLTRVCCDAQAFSPVVGQEIDAAVCFEALEHFSDPGRVLRALRCAPLSGGRRKFCDETWGINALGDVLACDRVFHMDDVRIQEIRAEARPESNIAAMLEWMRSQDADLHQPRAQGLPGLVAVPARGRDQRARRTPISTAPRRTRWRTRSSSA
jgi:SAM-dependent methyltransferase